MCSSDLINTQKSLAFLYISNEKIEREIKETILFTIATKRIKYLGIYLPKETKDLYIENYKYKPPDLDKFVLICIVSHHSQFMAEYISHL